jgi:hypothetical protein
MVQIAGAVTVRGCVAAAHKVCLRRSLQQRTWPIGDAVSAPFVERRSPDRPRNGDTKICPQCLTGIIEFNERYRLGEGRAVPAWVCDSPSCGHQELVRQNDGSRTAGKRRPERKSHS